MQTIMLATGIECSYPVIRDGLRRDQLEETGHYEHWREDLELTRSLGIRYLRYGIPFHRVNPAPNQFDWSFIDEVFDQMQRLSIEPIVDLCHFGMPDWLGNSFQNPEFPHAFALYAQAFASRFPKVRFYTPINEIFICARFSALYGWWNEQEQSDPTFVRAVSHMVQASLMGMQEIVAIQPEAIFIQSESNEYTHTICSCPRTTERANWENQVRFLSLDLLYGHQVRADIYVWLLANGLTPTEYNGFMNQGLHYRCVMGNDYYTTNERILDHDGHVVHVGEVFGWYLITKEYYERYHKPVMHTETNIREEDNAVAWLWKQWQNVMRLRAEGVPVVGFTWYSLIDQIDWDTALREPNGRVNALGLFDLNRKIRPVGEAYRNLIQEYEWIPIVPNSVFFQMDVNVQLPWAIEKALD